MKISRLTKEQTPPFSSFVFAAMRKRLSEIKSGGPHVAIGAFEEDRPVGLIYGELEADLTGHLRSVFVSPRFRHVGTGSALIASLEAEFAAAGCRKAQASYITGKPGTDALELILRMRGWDQPRLESLICKTDARMLDWAAYKAHWEEPNYELFNWSELTEVDRLFILESQEREHWIPDDLVPFQYEEGYDPLTSLGIRYCGVPVGWMITHRIAPDTVRYTCSFIKKECQGRFRISQIYQHAFRRQSEAGIPKAIWMVPHRHEAMIRFTKRRWGGQFADLTESRICTKTLAQATHQGASAGILAAQPTALRSHAV